jgi:hypothetical protein
MTELIRTGWFELSKKKRMQDIHLVLVVYTAVFLVWGVYRLLFRLPVFIEEVFLKFLVFGGPVLWVVLKKENKSLADLGMVTKGLLASVYFGLLFGLWLAVLGNLIAFIKSGGVSLNANINVRDFGNLMVLGMVTSVWEQLLFSGFILPRLVKDLGSEMAAVVITALLFALVHLPIQLATNVSLVQILVRMVLLFGLGLGNGVLYLRFKNLAAPIFAQLAWGSVIYLFG